MLIKDKTYSDIIVTDKNDTVVAVISDKEFLVDKDYRVKLVLMPLDED